MAATRRFSRVKWSYFDQVCAEAGQEVQGLVPGHDVALAAILFRLYVSESRFEDGCIFHQEIISWIGGLSTTMQGRSSARRREGEDASNNAFRNDIQRSNALEILRIVCHQRDGVPDGAGRNPGIIGCNGITSRLSLCYKTPVTTRYFVVVGNHDKVAERCFELVAPSLAPITLFSTIVHLTDGDKCDRKQPSLGMPYVGFGQRSASHQV